MRSHYLLKMMYGFSGFGFPSSVNVHTDWNQNMDGENGKYFL